MICAEPLRRRRALLPLLMVLGALGCGSLGLRRDDPMREELEELEREQARAERAIEASRAADHAPKTMEERLQLGDVHLAAGRVAQALWEYAAAHRMEPEAAAPRVRLAYVHLRHDPERARPLLESALEREPDDAAAHTGLGLALLDAGEVDDGLEHLARAVELAPDSAKAHAAFGVSLDQLGRHEEALVELEAAHELVPHDSRVMNNLGVAYLRSGRPGRAERMIRAALRQDDRDVTLRTNNLGMALALQDRFDEALEAFRRVGDEQSARSNLGYAYYVRGRYDEAIAEYEEALMVGGDASVQVLRNLEAARHALRSGSGTTSLPAVGGIAQDLSPAEAGTVPPPGRRAD